MLELLAYVVLLLVVMPALLLGVGKLVAVYNVKLSLPRDAVPNAAGPAVLKYEMLNQRLNAAAAANPLLPRLFSRRKG